MRLPAEPTVLQGVGGLSEDMASTWRLDRPSCPPLTLLFRRGCDEPEPDYLSWPRLRPATGSGTTRGSTSRQAGAAPPGLR
jgi:hypothetical protein